MTEIKQLCYFSIYIYIYAIFQYSLTIDGAIRISLAAFSIWRDICMSGRKLLDPPSFIYIYNIYAKNGASFYMCHDTGKLSSQMWRRFKPGTVFCFCSCTIPESSFVQVYTPAVEGYQLKKCASYCWTFVDTIMNGSVGGNLFSKYSYLFVDCNNSEICKQMNPCQAQIKIILGKVNKSNNNFFIFLY